LDPGFVVLPEDVVGPKARLVSSPSTVKALSSFETMVFKVQQSGSSQVVYISKFSLIESVKHP